MKVVSFYNDPTAPAVGQIEDWGGPAALDLVAHFLGIATHHNDNAVPCASAPPELTVVAGVDVHRNSHPVSFGK
ncbi:MAG: hypothetical protein ACSHWY_15230 [Octadecabacter sp.]